MQLIAFTGYSQVGKDEAAKALAPLGYERVAFADAVRDALYAIDPLVPIRDEHGGGTKRLSTLVDQVGWDIAKKYDEVRRLLQRVGTEGGRGIHGEECWVRVAWDKIIDRLRDGKKVAVTDVRFENEAEAIRRLSGVIVRVTRPGRGPVNNHVSDAGQDFDADHELVNDGTRTNWIADVRWFAKELETREVAV